MKITSFLKILLFALLSWLLLHVMAVFGIFLAAALPLWWLLELKTIPCFWCEIKKTNFCTFSHALATSGLILLFTFISGGFVFLEAKILFKLGFPPTPKTASFVIPPKGEYRLGEIFPMQIDISGMKEAINAVQADLSFDPGKLEVVDVSTKDSFANIFIQKEINNQVGYVRLTGGLPAPGFFADHGIFGTVFFRSKNPGIVKVEFLPSSLVLANDGRGTNILKDLASVFYLVLPEKLTQEEEKLQEGMTKREVLGEESDRRPSEEPTQMKFYEEKTVLGVTVAKEIEEGRHFDPRRDLLGILENIDRFVLSFWSRIFSFFAFKQ